MATFGQSNRPGGRRWIAWALALLAVGSAGTPGLARANRGGEEAEEAQPDRRRPGGALVIVGGGRIPDEVRDAFIERAGGPGAKLVLLPTGAADQEQCEANLRPWRDRGVAEVTLLCATGREQADDPEFLRPLDDATGVWLGGGNQEVFSRLYVGTALERKLREVLDRGGAVGGTSAGAAVLCPTMIAGGRGRARAGQGFDLLRHAVIDQHFLARNRLGRLLGFLEEHPGHVGLGVDENTALIVDRRDGSLRVVGRSYVIVVVPGESDRVPRFEVMEEGDEITLEGLRDPDAPVVSAIDPDATSDIEGDE
jgi:cyanophycinase